MSELNTKNVALVVLAVIIVALAFFATVADYNQTERDRSVACSQAGGSYSEGECEIR